MGELPLLFRVAREPLRQWFEVAQGKATELADILISASGVQELGGLGMAQGEILPAVDLLTVLGFQFLLDAHSLAESRFRFLLLACGPQEAPQFHVGTHQSLPELEAVGKVARQFARSEPASRYT